MSRFWRLPVIGPLLEELLAPSRVVYRRYGDREDRPRRLRAQGLALFAMVTGVLYVSWVWRTVNWTHPWIAGAFLLAETCSLLLFAAAAAGAWRMRFKPADAPIAPAPAAVDVLITVCGEPVPIVTSTVLAAMKISWIGPLRVWVLDDGGSPEVEAIARRCGAAYRSRRSEGLPLSDAKAGNLNFGLGATRGEYVLTLDADQVPSPAIVERLAPYLSLPNVAFVQSKQSFLVPDEDPFYCEDLVFYNSLQRAFDAHDTVLSCGSGVLYRRAALDDIGGFATWNLVEDLTTSYELHSRGWKSLYYPYPLAVGMAPDTIAGVYKQRGQWALDTMRLMLWRCPLVRRSLSWPKRLNYFVIGFSYLTAGFVAPIFYAVPVWSYVTGGSILTGSERDFALWRALYFLAMMLALRWMFRGHQPGKQFQMLVGLFPVYLVNTLRALRYRTSKPAYHVNNAGSRPQPWPAAVLLLPQLLLLTANVLGPFYALFADTATARLVAANIPVSALAIWSLSHVCFASFNRRLWSADRHPVRFYASAVES
jgi:cellulose synthase (UDP-forming)